jgi:hypothetical protein
MTGLQDLQDCIRVSGDSPRRHTNAVYPFNPGNPFDPVMQFTQLVFLSPVGPSQQGLLEVNPANPVTVIPGTQLG